MVEGPAHPSSHAIPYVLLLILSVILSIHGLGLWGSPCCGYHDLGILHLVGWCDQVVASPRIHHSVLLHAVHTHCSPQCMQCSVLCHPCVMQLLAYCLHLLCVGTLRGTPPTSPWGSCRSSCAVLSLLLLLLRSPPAAPHCVSLCTVCSRGAWCCMLCATCC